MSALRTLPEILRARRTPARVGVLALVVCGGLALAACSSAPVAAPTTTTTTVPAVHGVTWPVSKLRAAYLAAVTPSQEAFTTFSTRFNALGAEGTNKQMVSIITPTLAALRKSAAGVYALRLHSPEEISKKITTAVGADNTVYGGLLSLESGYGSRAFNLSAWGTAFGSAINSANTAANNLRRALGLSALVNKAPPSGSSG